MSQPIHEGHSLYCLAQAHLVGQDDVGTSTPVMRKKIYTLQLKGPQRSILYVVRLFVQLHELATGVEVRFAKV
jgi:hypothetical protein